MVNISIINDESGVYGKTSIPVGLTKKKGKRGQGKKGTVPFYS